MLTVYDFIELCIDPSMLDIEIWDNASQEVVWKGSGDEIPYDYEEYEVESFDPIQNGILALNITIDDEY